MYRILIFSDTHGSTEGCIRVLENIPCNLILHLGDLVRDAEEIKCIFPDIPIRYVAGNNDFLSNAPYELIADAGELKILLVHGHGISGKSLVRRAKELGCTVALRGHTHISEIYEEDGVTVINPGSISRPREPGHGTYAVIEIENGKPKACIIKL